MPFVAVGPTRLYRQIADQIAMLIANGEFVAGGRLPSERDLSALLGVSRTSVREAIIALEISGVVEVRLGTGIFVSEGQRGSLAPRPLDGTAQDGGLSPFELLSARRTIEGEIAALAAPDAVAEDVKALTATLTAMRENPVDRLRRDAADRAFHVRIAEITRNGALVWIVGLLWDQRHGEIFTRLESRFHCAELRERTLDDHVLIIAALAAHDAGGARRAMHRHLQRVTREFQRQWEGDAARMMSPSPGAGRRTPVSGAVRRQN